MQCRHASAEQVAKDAEAEAAALRCKLDGACEEALKRARDSFEEQLKQMQSRYAIADQNAKEAKLEVAALQSRFGLNDADVEALKRRSASADQKAKELESEVPT